MNRSAVAFFYRWAGYSWDPKKETRRQGRMRCALSLAEAEAEARAKGYRYEWELDGMTNREWTSEGRVTPTWECTLFSADSEPLAHLCGIDFGRKEPWGDPYRRVVEAELESEA